MLHRYFLLNSCSGKYYWRAGRGVPVSENIFEGQDRVTPGFNKRTTQVCYTDIFLEIHVLENTIGGQDRGVPVSKYIFEGQDRVTA